MIVTCGWRLYKCRLRDTTSPTEIILDGFSDSTNLFILTIVWSGDPWIRLPKGSVIDQSNINQLQDNTLIEILEIKAYHNQIAQAIRKGITHETYIQYHQWVLQSEIDLIQRISPQSELEKVLIENPYKILYD